MRNRLIILFLLIFSSYYISAQNTGYINGLIIDSLNNEKVLFANVFINNDTIQYGVVSDINGFYSLELPEGRHQISVTYIGYEDKIVEVDIIADKTLTENIYIHIPILRRPKPGVKMENLYGHWRIKCVERDGKTLRPNRYERKFEEAGLYYNRFPDHEAGIGIFSYNNACKGIGNFYFRHSGKGQITMDHTVLEVILLGCNAKRPVYNNLNFGKLYEDYTVTFKSDKKMIIENDKIKMICKKVN